MVNTRRSAARAAAASDPAASNSSAGIQSAAPSATHVNKASNSAAPETDLGPVTNGARKGALDGEATAALKQSSKHATKSPKVTKGRKARRSPSIASVSSLSSVDEILVEKGAPAATAITVDSAPVDAIPADSQQASRAVSRSGTPRPGINLKIKLKKGSNLKNQAGTKRGASETIAVEEVDEETRERRIKARENFDRELRRRKANEPREPDFTSYRESEEYLDGMAEAPEPRTRRATRQQSAPDTTKTAATTRTTTAAATPIPTPALGRRTRESTQSQRLQIDVISNAPRLEVTTPSTPGPQPQSDVESNGDPPPKRRKTARTKYSPVKLPNGVAPSHPASPSRSSPFYEGGREGKKVSIIATVSTTLINRVPAKPRPMLLLWLWWQPYLLRYVPELISRRVLGSSLCRCQ